MADYIAKGIRVAQLGVLINTLPAVTKLLAGVIANSYALVADAIESATDIFSSLIVMRGYELLNANQPRNFPSGMGETKIWLRR
jgi:divalent metal cation (Fe/Co/Zn/Cd) transporter